MNGSEIKLILRNSTEIFHISGIDHIYSGNPMDAGSLTRREQEIPHLYRSMSLS